MGERKDVDIAASTCGAGARSTLQPPAEQTERKSDTQIDELIEKAKERTVTTVKPNRNSRRAMAKLISRGGAKKRCKRKKKGH